MGVSVGIDLGTTFSAVAYIDPKTKQPTIIPNREGKRITPSERLYSAARQRKPLPQVSRTA